TLPLTLPVALPEGGVATAGPVALVSGRVVVGAASALASGRVGVDVSAAFPAGFAGRVSEPPGLPPGCANVSVTGAARTATPSRPISRDFIPHLLTRHVEQG